MPIIPGASQFISKGNTVNVTFHSDAKNNYPGFRLTYMFGGYFFEDGPVK